MILQCFVFLVFRRKCLNPIQEWRIGGGGGDQNLKATPSVSPKLLNLNHAHHSKNWFSWPNLCKIEVVITSLIKMLQLSNFGCMTKFTI